MGCSHGLEQPTPPITDVTTTVPFVGLARQHESLQEELTAVFRRLLATSAFTLGQEVEGFESEFAAYCDVEHAVGVASGTAALMLALRAAGIGPGDEVVVPAHTFIASALGVIHAGATPVFCDVEASTGLIDPASAERVLSPRTAAIMAVHLYGQVCDMPRLRALADRRGLFLLEDAAQAHGATHGGRRAGSIGDAAAFSFYPSKNLGALGDGGAVTTGSEEIAQRVRELRHLGQRGKGRHVVLGYNERLDGLQAALLRVKLPHVDAWNAARRRRAATLTSAIGDVVRTLEDTDITPCVYHLYPVRVPERERFMDELQRAGIQCGVHYSPVVPEHPAIVEVVGERAPGETPHADDWAATEVSLPMFPELQPHELERLIQAVRRAR
jgi:dTDP-4-amino-4,6-dideoxygalactose transaminase